MNHRSVLILSISTLGAALIAAAAALPVHSPLSRPAAPRVAEVEADWKLQDTVRNSSSVGITTADDAAGGCDGVKNGKWGFHTNEDAKPWWQVDLGASQPLDHVVIYNRCDTAERTSNLILLLSDDGHSWREVYRQTGAVFYGATDGKPLRVPLAGEAARFVRTQLPDRGFMHLDEVEVYGKADPTKNIALGRPADQSSVSQWSVRHIRSGEPVAEQFDKDLLRGHALLANLSSSAGDLGTAFVNAEKEYLALAKSADANVRQEAGLKVRWAVRKLALTNPLLDFDRILFVKRAPGTYSHMSDQNYGWWSRPGGGLFVLEGFKTDAPRVRCLTPTLPGGSCMDPDLSYDGKKILFAWCKFYPNLASLGDKETKANVPEDAFYHIFEINADGTGLRQLTRGKYDDFDARYLPNNEVVFLSTRRGQSVQCGQQSAMATLNSTQPDSYVRCGGGPSRPVAVYTLHLMDEERTKIRTLSPFENFEWSPMVGSDGRIIYARWDYVDRDNMPYMKLWATAPDGTNPQVLYGNMTRAPYSVFEARPVPNSRKIVFTASAHHSVTGGSLVLLDPAKGSDGPEPLTRLTPEVCYPEIEGWSSTYYASPYPLSEKSYLVAWSGTPLNSEGGANPVNAQGIYLFDASGNLELLYRDSAISSLCPIPIRPRVRPPVLSDSVAWKAPQDEGKIVIQNIYEGLTNIQRGSITQLRVVGMPAKTQPTMNSPMVGMTHDDPGKFVLGTVPVERDGSAYFRAPSGVPLFFQALDKNGMAVQTMRSLTYLQPRETLSCIGCHEARNTAPPNMAALSTRRAPSRIAVGPEGSWPLRFDQLVQPVLDRNCVNCHRFGPSSGTFAANKPDLSAVSAYESMVSFGGAVSLRENILARYREGRSIAGGGPARTSALLALLRKGHYGVQLSKSDTVRLVTWMDTYAQNLGAFSDSQEADLKRLKTRCASLLVEP